MNYNKAERIVDKGEVVTRHEKAGKIPKAFGLCSTCKWMEWRKTALGTVSYRCGSADCDTLVIKPHTVFPSEIDPIIDCDDYCKRGEMTLHDMVQMATLINVNKRVKPGFKVEDGETEVTIKTPDQIEEEEKEERKD